MFRGRSEAVGIGALYVSTPVRNADEKGYPRELAAMDDESGSAAHLSFPDPAVDVNGYACLIAIMSRGAGGVFFFTIAVSSDGCTK